MSKFDLSVCLPDRIAFKGQVDHVCFTTFVGQMEVHEGHEDMLTVIEPGVLFFSVDNVFTYFMSGRGVACIEGKKVSIAIDILDEGSAVDAERAKKALTRAEERLSAKDIQTIDYERAKRSLERAKARLHAHETYLSHKSH